MKRLLVLATPLFLSSCVCMTRKNYLKQLTAAANYGASKQFEFCKQAKDRCEIVDGQRKVEKEQCDMQVEGLKADLAWCRANPGK